MTRAELFNEIKKDRETYADMTNFCCDNMILNNDIFNKFFEHTEVYSGCDYDEETDEYTEVFQYYIIDGSSADRLAEYTNELVYYIPEIDLYLLGVTHWGTGWNGVSANWKDSIEEYEN